VKALLFIAGAFFAAGSPGVAAEQVYRCGPDGRLYQNKPCPQGKAVDVADPRSAEQQKSARAAAKADVRLADELERDRRARETGAPPVKASGFNARPVPSEPAASPPAKARKKRKDTPAQASQTSGDFVAAPPLPTKPKAADASRP
jgi:hypothetical protein